jgi:hypothetical protein
MAYGLRIKNASGTVIFDSSNIVARIRYSNEASSGVSDSTTLSDISGKTTYPFSIALEAGLKIPHSVDISGTTFSWTAQSTSRHSSSDSLVGVIIRD